MLKVQTAGSLVKSASGHMVHAAGIYPGFCSIDGMLVHRRVTASIKFTYPFVHLAGDRHHEALVPLILWIATAFTSPG